MPGPVTTTVTDERYFYIAGADSDGSEVAGFIRGVGPATDVVRGFVRGGSLETSARYIYAGGWGSGSSAQAGYARGSVAKGDTRGGYTRGLVSTGATRGGYTRGAGTSISGSLSGYVLAADFGIADNRIIGSVQDLGSSYNTRGWYYDWAKTEYNDASGSLLARSANSALAVWAEPWEVATKEAIPLSTVRRYHQFAVDVTAYEPYTFILHQVSICARADYGQVFGTVYDRDSHAPLSGSLVKMGVTSQRADAAGGYRFSSVPRGTVSIKSSFPNYLVGTYSVSVLPGLSTRQDIYLTPKNTPF